eukprot:3941150-Rhodomonas_salina.4
MGALSAYALATQCPVLTYCMVLPGLYGMRKRGQVRSTICLRACYAVSGTDLPYAAPLSAYALATKCPVLDLGTFVPAAGHTHQPRAYRGGEKVPDLLSGTVLSYQPPRCYGISSTDIMYGLYGAMRVLWNVWCRHATSSLCHYARATECPVLMQRIVLSGLISQRNEPEPTPN